MINYDLLALVSQFSELHPLKKGKKAYIVFNIQLRVSLKLMLMERGEGWFECCFQQS